VPWAVQFPTELVEHGTPELLDRAATALEPVRSTIARFGHEQATFAERVVEAARANTAVREPLRGVLTPRHPSQLYAALLEGALLFVVLWIMRTRVRLPRGAITGTFFILYATLRIVSETFREPDPAWHVGPLSAGQFLSLFFFAVGGAFLVGGLHRRVYEAAFAPRP